MIAPPLLRRPVRVLLERVPFTCERSLHGAEISARGLKFAMTDSYPGCQHWDNSVTAGFILKF
jgi:hypothetical protein